VCEQGGEAQNEPQGETNGIGYVPCADRMFRTTGRPITTSETSKRTAAKSDDFQRAVAVMVGVMLGEIVCHADR
jgi:hypothetical protein